MDFDPFDDILSGSDGGNARAGAKFRPKVKPQSRKETCASIPSNLTNAVEDISSVTTSVDEDCRNPHTKIPDIMSCTTTVDYPLPNLPRSHEIINDTEALDPGFLLSNGDKSSAPVDASSQYPVDGESMDSRGALQLESTALYAHGDLQSGSARSGRETADIFFDIDDIIGDSATSNVNTVRKFQPRVKVDAEHKSRLPVSSVSSKGGGEGTISDAKGSFRNASNAENPEGEFGRPSHSSIGGSTLGPCSFVPTDTCEFVPQGAVNSRETGLFDYDQDFTTNAAGTEGEEQTLPGLQSSNDISHTTLGDAEWDPPGLEYFDDDQHTALADHDFADYTLEYPIGEEPTQPGDALGPNTSIPQEAINSETVPMFPRKQSIRSQKKKLSTALENNSTKIHSTNDEPSQETLDGDGDNEYREDYTTGDKKAQNGKPKAPRKRKNASGGPEASNKEPPKKKFSHTTQKPKRQLNKTLLETPEDEIDPKKLPLKDLILLGELREKRLKDAITAKKSAPNQSVDNSYSYPEDAAPYDPDDPFATMQDDLNPEYTTTHRKVNYHSYMKKRPRVRWSKERTELFYEAIRQFGTDFTMIEQMFPDLDSDPIRRRQMVKAKYKIEERKQPTRLHDAFTNRSKNHSHYKLVIEKLRQAEREQNSDEDMESVGVSAEAEEIIPETDEVAENTEVGDEDMEMPKVDSPVKSVHETEDDSYKWSPANSDYDEYVPY
ncbi:hypothetical protein ACHQM5_028154 [Ranunculus cassubicifolius]